MILYTKEFDLDGQKITVGHDRETGKRYLLGECHLLPVTNIEGVEFAEGENCIALCYNNYEIYDFVDCPDYQGTIDKLKSIFWIT